MERFIDPRTLARVKDMPLVARSVAEGFLSGIQPSQQRGVGHLLRRVATPAAMHHRVEAVRGQVQGDRAADAPGGAGHQHGAADVLDDLAGEAVAVVHQRYDGDLVADAGAAVGASEA